MTLLPWQKLPKNSRVYETDGAAMFVEPDHENTLARRANACSEMEKKVISTFQGKEPVFILDREYIEKALEHLDCQQIAFYATASNEPVLVVGETVNYYAVIMPMKPERNKFPTLPDEPAQIGAVLDGQAITESE